MNELPSLEHCFGMPATSKFLSYEHHKQINLFEEKSNFTKKIKSIYEELTAYLENMGIILKFYFFFYSLSLHYFLLTASF